MYIRERLKSPKVYVGIAIGTIIVLFHFISDYYVIKPQLDGNVAFFTPYTRWIGYDVGAMTTFYYTLLPLLACLTANQLFYQDLKSGFIKHAVKEQGGVKYSFSHLGISFLAGFLTVSLPLLLDFVLFYCTLPNMKPDPLLNMSAGVTSDLTYLAGLYYSNPLLHVAFYLFLAGLAGGLAATISLAVTCFISNYFADVAAALLVTLIFNVFSVATDKAFLSPNLFVIPVCPLYIPSLTAALSELLLGALLFSLIYFYGVRRHVFS